MEITATTPTPQVDRQPTPDRSGATAPDTDAALQAQIERAAAQQELGKTQALAILSDSGIPPAEISKFSVRLDIHKETGRVVASIRNKETGEVLQKFPSDSILRGVVMLRDMIGTILDEPA